MPCFRFRLLTSFFQGRSSFFHALHLSFYFQQFVFCVPSSIFFFSSTSTIYYSIAIGVRWFIVNLIALVFRCIIRCFFPFDASSFRVPSAIVWVHSEVLGQGEWASVSTSLFLLPLAAFPIFSVKSCLDKKKMKLYPGRTLKIITRNYAFKCKRTLMIKKEQLMYS